MSTHIPKIRVRMRKTGAVVPEKSGEKGEQKVLLPQGFRIDKSRLVYYNTISVNVCVIMRESVAKKMISTLLFDLGGTLHTVKRTPESRRHFCSHLLSVLSEHGIFLDITPEALDAMLAVNGEEYKHLGERTLVELPQSVIWSQYYLKELHIPEERLAPFAEELSFLYDHERVINTPRPHLKETMEALRAMGIHLGIVSNIISTTLVPYVLKQYGILDLMECIVMSSNVGIRKPDPRIFDVAMQELGVTAVETGYVDDTISRDVLGARNAHLGLCVRIENPAIAHRDTAFQGPDAPKADFVIREIDELVPLLAGINGQRL